MKTLIYWDKSDPQDKGWAWRQGEDSGSLDAVSQNKLVSDEILKQTFIKEIGPAKDFEIIR